MNPIRGIRHTWGCRRRRRRPLASRRARTKSISVYGVSEFGRGRDTSRALVGDREKSHTSKLVSGRRPRTYYRHKYDLHEKSPAFYAEHLPHGYPGQQYPFNLSHPQKELPMHSTTVGRLVFRWVTGSKSNFCWTSVSLTVRSRT